MCLRGLARRHGPDAEALADATFTATHGDLVLVTGRSGSGKTTLLNLVAGIDRPDAGSVTIGGLRVDRMGERERAGWRARTTGCLFQHHLLAPGSRAVDAVAGPLMWGRGMPAPEARDLATAWLERVGLGAAAHKRVERMSGGERQRVAAARALAGEPPLLLADEPTAHLDASTGEALRALLRSAAEDWGACVLVVSHEGSAEAWGATRRVTVRDGVARAE